MRKNSIFISPRYGLKKQNSLSFFTFYATIPIKEKEGKWKNSDF